MDIINAYSCPTCNKCYKRYSFFLRHKLVCNSEYISKTNNLPDSIKYPSEIQQTLNYLMCSNNLMREQLKKIQSEKKQEKKLEKKKINLLHWLNKNYYANFDYLTYIKDIELDKKYLNLLKENNVYTVIKDIFNNYFTKERENNCFKAFTIKTNKIYVFLDSKNWKELTYDDMKNIISKVSNEFLSLLNEWQEENKEKIFNDTISSDYLKLLKKINSININNSTFVNKIYNILYNHLKISIQIIEYELY